jgi:hypothetical protein
MKTTRVILCVFTFYFLCCVSVFAANTEDSTTQESESSSETPESSFPLPKEKPFIVFNEGASASWITRIIKKETRSNFVFQDFMFGAYMGFKTVNMQPINSLVRVSLFYPATFTFNKVPQIPKNIIRYALDVFAGFDFEANMWEFLRFNVTPGLHVFFQNSDRWNYLNVGGGLLAGVELPIAARWTMLANGMATLDYGNFGTNKDLEPYDIVYQYQVDVGVRYSKKNTNKFSYIGALFN